MAENEKVLESIQGKLNILSAAFQTFSQDLINSEIIKFFVGLATGILNVLDALVRLHMLLPAIVGNVLFFKSIGIAKNLADRKKQVAGLARELILQKGFTDQLKGAVYGLTAAERDELTVQIKAAMVQGALNEAKGEAILNEIALIGTTKALSASNRTLASTFKSVAASIPVWGWISLVITFVIEAVTAFISLSDVFDNTTEKVKNLEEEFENTTNTVKSISSEFQQLKSSADEVILRFAELAKGVNALGENESLSDEEYSEFLSLQNQIAELFPDIDIGLDSNGNHMLALSYSANTLTESLENLLEVARQNANIEIADSMSEALDDIGKLNENYDKQIQSLKDDKEEIEELKNGVEFDLSNPTDSTSFGLLEEKLNAYLLDFTETYTNSGFTTITLDYEEGTAKKNYENFISGIDKQINDLENKTESSWSKISPITTAWLQTTSDYDTLSTEMQNVLTKIFGNIDYSEIGITDEDELKKYLTDKYIAPFTEASFEVQSAYSDLFELEPSELSFSDYKNEIEELSNVIAVGMGKVSWEEVLKEAGLDEYYKSCVDARDNIVGIFQDASQEIIDNMSAEDIIKIWETVETGIYSSWDDIIVYIESKKIVDLFDTSKLEDLQSALEKVKSAYTSVSTIVSDYNKNGYYSSENLKSLLELEPEYINTLIDEKGQIDLNSEAYKKYIATKAETLVLTQIKSLYESITTSMSLEQAQAYANAEAYDVENGSLKDIILTMTQYYAILAKQKDVENGTTAYTSALSRSIDTVSNYAAVYDSWLNSLSTSTNEFTAATESSTTATDKSKTALEEQKEALEEQKEALEEQKEALEEQKDALDDYKQSLEDAQSSLKDLIDLVIEYIEQTKENEKEALNDEIDLLEEQKDALEEQKDSFAEVIDKKKEAIKLTQEEKQAEEELLDKQKAVAKSRLSLAIANLDDSSAGKKNQKQAREDLSSNEKELNDYISDQAYDKATAALDEQQEKFEETIDKQSLLIDNQVEKIESKIDEIDDYLDNSRQIYEDACNMIDNDNGTLYDNLWNYTYKYTTQTRAEFDYLWNNAQTAIRTYQGDNVTLISVMEILQGKIYDIDGQISNLSSSIDSVSGAIDSTSGALSSTSGAIDSVSNSLSGLGTSVSDYADQLKKLIDVSESIDIGDKRTNGEKTSFWVDYRGNRYQTGYDYSGDTTANRLLAANELTKQIAKDISGFDQYGLSVVQELLGVGTKAKQKTGWYYDFDGTRYSSRNVSVKAAIEEIRKQIAEKYGKSSWVLSQITEDKLKRYAKGTRNSVGGLSVTQEEGLEAIFGKLSNGEYTLMPSGSQVFDKDMTDNLHDFSADPQKYISGIADGIDLHDYFVANMDDVIESITSSRREAFGELNQMNRVFDNMLTNAANTQTNISPTIQINVQGDATQSTVRALREEADRIVDMATKNIMNITLRNKRII